MLYVTFAATRWSFVFLSLLANPARYSVMLRGPLSLPTLSMRRLGASAILFAGLLAVPTEAEATCGDYLWMPEHTARQAHAAEDGWIPASGQRPLPCNGPECSRAPQAPLAPVPPPLTVDTHEQGVLATLERATGRDELAWAAHEAAPRPVMFGSSIFRPPR